MKDTIYCTTDNDGQTQKIISSLKSAGFSDSNISVLYPDRANAEDVNAGTLHSGDETMTGMSSTTEKSALTGAAAGSVIGGALGLLAGLGSLTIPGIGPFIAAGPLMSLLSTSAVGGSVGFIAGALVGSGVTEDEARRYEDSLKAGNTLIAVRYDGSDQVDRIRTILQNEGAHDISSTEAFATL